MLSRLAVLARPLRGRAVPLLALCGCLAIPAHRAALATATLSISLATCGWTRLGPRQAPLPVYGCRTCACMR